MDIGYATRRLEQGDLTPIADIEHGRPIFLNDVSLLEPRLTQRTLGSGIKGRMAKDLYFYVPQQQSPKPAEQLEEVDRGTLTVAANGIAFAGQSRRVGVGFHAIESIGHTRDGITIIAKNLHRLHFGGGGAVVALKVQDRMYREPLSGTLLRLLVEAVIKASLERR